MTRFGHPPEAGQEVLQGVKLDQDKQEIQVPVARQQKQYPFAGPDADTTVQEHDTGIPHQQRRHQPPQPVPESVFRFGAIPGRVARQQEK